MAESGYKPAATGTGAYSHADMTYVRKKRRKLSEHAGGGDEDGELNIVPYLDILINLIMFLLVGQATLVSLGMINVNAPSYSPPGGAGVTDPTNAKPQLRLTIGVAKDGYYIAAKGGVLPGTQPETPGETTAEGVAKRKPTIPRKADGSYDYRALARRLRAIKDAIKETFPNANSVYVAADDTIKYEVIVKTLDASREDGKGKLFPNVAFTQIN